MGPRITRSIVRGALGLLLAAPALAGCGSGTPLSVGVTSEAPMATNCHAIPPDVLSRPQAIVMGDDSTLWSDADRHALQYYAATHPEVYAEAISSSDGHTYVGFTSDAPQHLADLRRSISHPSIVRAYCSAYSNRQLQAVQNRIMADIPTWRSKGITIRGAGSGPVGLVVVMVDKPTQATLSRLRDRYGPAVTRVEAPPPDIDDGLSRGLPTPSGG